MPRTTPVGVGDAAGAAQLARAAGQPVPGRTDLAVAGAGTRAAVARGVTQLCVRAGAAGRTVVAVQARAVTVGRLAPHAGTEPPSRAQLLAGGRCGGWAVGSRWTLHRLTAADVHAVLAAAPLARAGAPELAAGVAGLALPVHEAVAATGVVLSQETPPAATAHAIRVDELLRAARGARCPATDRVVAGLDDLRRRAGSTGSHCRAELRGVALRAAHLTVAIAADLE